MDPPPFVRAVPAVAVTFSTRPAVPVDVRNRRIRTRDEGSGRILGSQWSGGDDVGVEDLAEPLGYRLITGPDDAEFCARVSSLMSQGYQLYGSPALTFDGQRVIAAQALVLAEPAPPEMPRAVG